MDSFINKEGLATVSGMVATVSLIVEFTKGFLKNKLGRSSGFIRLYTWIISFILLAVFTNKTWNIENVILTMINAILISLTAMGFYEVMKNPFSRDKNL